MRGVLEIHWINRISNRNILENDRLSVYT
jgi:hypothetical protein